MAYPVPPSLAEGGPGVLWLPGPGAREAHGALASRGYPAAARGPPRGAPTTFGPRGPPNPRPLDPQTPAGAFPPDGRTRNADSAETRLVHRQPRPTHAGPTGRPSPVARGRRERGGWDGGDRRGGGRTGLAPAHRTGHPNGTVCT